MRVVIAEDAAVLREGLARLLTDRGHEVCAAVADAARTKLDAIAKRVALLMLVLTEPTPADAEVHVDRTLVPRTDLRRAIVLAPGPHLITATAGGATTAA